MSDALESALLIRLNPVFRWESALEPGAALTVINTAAPFDALAFQQRDRELAYRDLINAAAVVDVSIEVSSVWNAPAIRPILQGVASSELTTHGDDLWANSIRGQVVHVTDASLPSDAATRVDKQLAERDALIYETLARACAVFSDPPVISAHSTGTATSLWSLGQGVEARADINTSLPLDKRLFLRPDQNLADRDNQLAGYAAQLAQVLRNPFEFANRLYVKVTNPTGLTEVAGQDLRELEVYTVADPLYQSGTAYALGAEVTYQGIYYRAKRATSVVPVAGDDWEAGIVPTKRTWVAEPLLSDRNRIIYDYSLKTLQWMRESTMQIHVPQIYALTVPGVLDYQRLTTVAQIPEVKDALFWRRKAARIVHGSSAWESVAAKYSTAGETRTGCAQLDCASILSPSVTELESRVRLALGGTVSAGERYRISALVRPFAEVAIAGGTTISEQVYALASGAIASSVATLTLTTAHSIVVSSPAPRITVVATGTSHDRFTGVSTVTSVGSGTISFVPAVTTALSSVALVGTVSSQLPPRADGGVDFTLKFDPAVTAIGSLQPMEWQLALPKGTWTMTVEYTNLSASTEGFGVRAVLVEGRDRLRFYQAPAPGEAVLIVGREYEADYGAGVAAGRIPIGLDASGTKATGTLTLSANPTAGETVTVGLKFYTFRASVSGGAANDVLIGATTTLSIANLLAAVNVAVPADAGVKYGTGTVANPLAVAVAGVTGVKATQTLTSNGTAPTAADTVVVGGTTYTFRTTLTPTEGEVLIGASAATALANLKSAINHTGTPDTDYKCAAANTQVEGTTLTSTTLLVRALLAGTPGNSIASTDTAATLSWGAATLTGGVNDTVTLRARNTGLTGNAVVTDETLVSGSFTAATLTGGVNPSGENFIDELVDVAQGTPVKLSAYEVAITGLSTTLADDTVPWAFRDDDGNPLDNGTVVTSPEMQLRSSGFGQVVQLKWTYGAGHLHVRSLKFVQVEVPTSRYALTARLVDPAGGYLSSVASPSTMDVIGAEGVHERLAFEFDCTVPSSSPCLGLAWTRTGEYSGSTFIADDQIPLQIRQVTLEKRVTLVPTPGAYTFSGWRGEMLDRAMKHVVQAYAERAALYPSEVFSSSPVVPPAHQLDVLYPVGSEVDFNGVYYRNTGSATALVPAIGTPATLPSYGRWDLRHYAAPIPVAGAALVAQAPWAVITSSQLFTAWTPEVFDAWLRFMEPASTRLREKTGQAGAVLRATAAHVGRPALVPAGFRQLNGQAAAYGTVATAWPTLTLLQPWMVEAGAYAFHPDFWSPETVGS